MLKCRNCSQLNPENVATCQSCGVSLVGAISVVATESHDKNTKKTLVKKILAFLTKSQVEADAEATQRIEVSPEPEPEPPLPTERDPSEFPEGTSLLLRVNGYDVVINTPRFDVLMGRFKEGKLPPPDAHIINLSHYEAYDQGVSRLHAMIRPTGDEHLGIIDLGSSNGTTLNGQWLNAYEMYHLYDGDEVMMGQLPVSVFFLYR